jgi:hypothetical protein
VPVLVTQVMGPVLVVPGNSSFTRTSGSGLKLSGKIGGGVVGVLFAGAGIVFAMIQMWKQKFGDEKPTSTSHAK